MNFRVWQAEKWASSGRRLDSMAGTCHWVWERCRKVFGPDERKTWRYIHSKFWLINLILTLWIQKLECSLFFNRKKYYTEHFRDRWGEQTNNLSSQVRVAGLRVTVLLDPHSFDSVLNDRDSFDFTRIRSQVIQKVFSLQPTNIEPTLERKWMEQ